MELLSPAGNIEKLHYAYRYGADAAYIGIGKFSLRARADNFNDKEFEQIKQIKGDKKLYCALNIYFHNQDIKRLEEEIDYLANYPFDAFIISDIGLIPLLRKRFPGVELHLSTQANCTNYESARMYRDLGFSRVILGREVSLQDIGLIKSKVSDLEVEVFAHGAMCLAYAGRCFLSRWMIDRSANKGDCAHSCRWDYRPMIKDPDEKAIKKLLENGIYIEENERPGQYYPIYEGDNWTSILSSKDLCMIDYVKELIDHGVDSLKIEGRMKSLYYAAVVTRAYRKAIDDILVSPVENLEDYKNEIYKVSHRKFSTGFFFDNDDIEEPAEHMEQSEYAFLGTVGKDMGDGSFEIDVKNQIRDEDIIEFIGPDVLYMEDTTFTLIDEKGEKAEKADHNKYFTIRTEKEIEPGYIIRKKKRSNMNV